MGYYNYHAIASNLIKTGHCTHANLTEKYNSLSPALVLYFDNHKPMPVRENKFSLYFSLLCYYGVNIIINQT